MFQLGRRLSRAAEQLAPLVGLIAQAAAIAETDMASDGSVVLLSDFLVRADAAWSEFWASWTNPPAEVAEAWTTSAALPASPPLHARLAA